MKTLHRKKRHVRRHITRRRLRGGTLLGEGGFGCVFSPTLLCKGETVRNSSRVSKLTSAAIAQKEFTFAQKIRALNKEQRHFLVPDTMCDLNAAAQQQHEELKTCEEYVTTSPKSDPFNTLLHGTKGGFEIDALLSSAPDSRKEPLEWTEYVDCFEGLAGFFLGVEKLHTEGFAHLDITPYNVLVTRSHPYRFHLIDFGLSQALTALRGPVSGYSHNYEFYPYYTRFLSYPERKILWQDLSDYYHFFLLRKRPDTKFWIPPEVFYTGPDGTPRMSVWTMEESVADVSRDALAKGTDMYGLALLVGALYGSQLGHRVVFGKVSYSGVPLAELEARGIRPDVAKWHADVAREITVPLFTLLEQMMAMDVRQVPSIQDARRRYEALLPAMRRLFTEEALQRGMSSWFEK